MLRWRDYMCIEKYEIASVLRSKAAAEDGASSRQDVTRNDGFADLLYTYVHCMNNPGTLRGHVLAMTDGDVIARPEPVVISTDTTKIAAWQSIILYTA